VSDDTTAETVERLLRDIRLRRYQSFAFTTASRETMTPAVAVGLRARGFRLERYSDELWLIHIPTCRGTRRRSSRRVGHRR
jgi:hypothetical protein